MVVKCTPRVGPCQSFSLSLYMTDTSEKRTPSTGPYLVRFRMKLTDRRIIYSERNAVTIQALKDFGTLFLQCENNVTKIITR